MLRFVFLPTNYTVDDHKLGIRRLVHCLWPHIHHPASVVQAAAGGVHDPCRCRCWPGTSIYPPLRLLAVSLELKLHRQCVSRTPFPRRMDAELISKPHRNIDSRGPGECAQTRYGGGHGNA
jgi:hypothetical protein